MSGTSFRLCLAAVVLTAMTAPSFAHHSSANYDTQKETVLLDDPKIYAKPWIGRDRLQLRLMPADTDLMEMIPSASEAAEYRRLMAAPRK